LRQTFGLHREGKGAIYYGIGADLARIADVILRDQRSILIASTPVAQILNVCDVTISLPHLLGGDRLLATLPLDKEEETALQAGAQVVCDAIPELDASTPV